MNCGKQPNLLPSECKMINCDNIISRTEDLQESGVYNKNPQPVFYSEALLGTVNLSKTLINETKIPGGFSEIKKVTKKIILNQCKIVGTTLFVEGYVIKNINYVLPKGCEKDTDTCKAYFNLWRDIEVKVPFNAAADLGTDPNLEPKQNLSSEYTILCDTMKDKCCDCGFMGDSLCENLNLQQTVLNEPAYGKLISYSITDLDINKKYCCSRRNKCDEDRKRRDTPFNVLVEKMSVDLQINICKKLPIVTP